MSGAPAPYGTPDAACDFLAELAGGVIAHATVMQSYAEMRHLPGLEYAAKCTATYLRAMTAAIGEVERSRAVTLLRERTADIGPGQGV